MVYDTARAAGYGVQGAFGVAINNITDPTRNKRNCIKTTKFWTGASSDNFCFNDRMTQFHVIFKDSLDDKPCARPECRVLHISLLFDSRPDVETHWRVLQQQLVDALVANAYVDPEKTCVWLMNYGEMMKWKGFWRKNRGIYGDEWHCFVMFNYDPARMLRAYEYIILRRIAEYDGTVNGLLFDTSLFRPKEGWGPV